ncbi:hypothetical protein MYX65_12585, partial [Acidobacteria bacterium AH-259-L09]|nr:hypothetical protein [Acidobacteria bacterium AH-259-L09]
IFADCINESDVLFGLCNADYPRLVTSCMPMLPHPPTWTDNALTGNWSTTVIRIGGTVGLPVLRNNKNFWIFN